jgi:hypothetical protein
LQVQAATLPTPKQAARECKIRPRGHAKMRQAQRGITDGDIREAIANGTLGKRRDRWEARTAYVTVVFRLAPCNIFIITVFYPRA